MKRIGSLLPNALDKEVFRIARAQSVLNQWDEIVGPGLAQRSWPDRYERNVAWVAVTGSAWAQELRLMKEVILRRLRDRAGDREMFVDVRFGVRKLPVKSEEIDMVEELPAEPTGLTIREIAERRLRKWKDAAGD